MSLTAKERLDFLQQTPIGEPIPLESLLMAGFPSSCSYPAFWSSKGTGSRLAFALGCRVVFSHKLLTITLVPLEEDERTLRLIRFDRERKDAREKRDRHTASVNFLMGQLIDAEKRTTESCSDPATTGGDGDVLPGDG
jgi:hypothetical protein